MYEYKSIWLDWVQKDYENLHDFAWDKNSTHPLVITSEI